MADPRVTWRISATDQVTQTLRGIDSRLGGLTRSFGRLGGIIGTTFGAGFIARAGLEALKAADDMQDLADRIGVSASALDEYRIIAEQSGSSLDAFSRSLTFLARVNDQAVQGSEKAATAFERLGVNAQQLAQLPLDQRFEVVADALSRVTNEGERLALGTAVLGKGFQDLGNVVEGGASKLRNTREELRRTGKSLSDDQIKALADAGQAWEGFTAVAATQSKRLLAEVAPAFTSLANIISGAIPLALDTLEYEFSNVSTRVKPAAKEVGTSSSSAIVEALVDTLNVKRNYWTSAVYEFFLGPWERAAAQAAKAMATFLSNPFNIGGPGVFSGFDEYARGLADAIGSVDPSVPVIDDSDILAGIDRTRQEIINRLEFDVPAPDASAYVEFLARLKAATDRERQEIARIIEQTRSPLEEYRAEVSRAIDLQQRYGFSVDVLNKYLQQLGANLGEATAAQVANTEAGQRWIAAQEQVARVRADLVSDAERIAIEMQKIADVTVMPVIDIRGLPEVKATAAAASITMAQLGDQVAEPRIDLVGLETLDIQLTDAGAKLSGLDQLRVVPVISPTVDLLGLENLDAQLTETGVKISGLDQLVVTPIIDPVVNLEGFAKLDAQADASMATLRAVDDMHVTPTISLEGIDTVQASMDSSLLSLEEMIRAQSQLAFESSDAWQAVSDAAAESGDTIDDVLKAIKDATQGYASDITDIFFDTTKSIGDMFEDLLERIAKMLVEKAIVQPILDFVGSAIGSWAGSTFGGAGGTGGGFGGGGIGSNTMAATRETPSFMPSVEAARAPALAAAGPTANITFQINSLDPRTAASVIAENRNVIVGIVQQGMHRAGRRPDIA